MEIMELLKIGQQIGEQSTKITTLEKALKIAKRGAKLWKLLALAEAGVIIFTYAGSIGKSKKEEVTDEDIVIEFGEEDE